MEYICFKWHHKNKWSPFCTEFWKEKDNFLALYAYSLNSLFGEQTIHVPSTDGDMRCHGNGGKTVSLDKARVCAQSKKETSV